MSVEILSGGRTQEPENPIFVVKYVFMILTRGPGSITQTICNVVKRPKKNFSPGAPGDFKKMSKIPI